MPPKKSKTQLLLESDPDAVLTKKGRAPSTMSETALEKLKLAREKYQTTCRLKREAKLLPTPEPVPIVPVVLEPVVLEPVVPVVPVVPVPAVPESDEDEPVEPPVAIKKKTKKPKKPVVIIEESASDSDDNSNVIFIKKRSNKPKSIPAELPAVAVQPIEPSVIRREFIQPIFAKNPFYNYNGY